MDLLIHMFSFIFYRNSFYMFILMILSLSYPYMPYVSFNYVLCWCFVVMYINCVVVYGRTSCKTASGWWVILVKYVLIKKKKKKKTYCNRYVQLVEYLTLRTYTAENLDCVFFLPEASFGLRVLSLPASVCLCVRVFVCPCVCVSITGLSAR